MKESIVPGKIYFELNNDPDSQKPLSEFFAGLGFEVVGRKEDQYFERMTTFRDKYGLQFDIIWYKNLATLRFGEWGKSFMDIKFDKIEGSWLQKKDHLTLNFVARGEQKGRLAIYRGASE